MYQVTVETSDDYWEVEALYDLCFAPGRKLLSSYVLREGVAQISELCLVVRDGEGVLAAAIRFWPVRIGDTDEALLLGPIAVHPTRQGEGLGALLMQEALTRARHMPNNRILLVGDAPYYARFGFIRLDDVEMPPPTNPNRVLGLGDWQGISGKVHKAHSAPPQTV